MATRKKRNSAPKKRRPARADRKFFTHPRPIKSLAAFFDACDVAMKKGATYWFRGHADVSWTLTPSALRYTAVESRNRALALLADFKRYAEIKLPNPPSRDEELKWVQLARHYGLPTRLLDWTRNAAIALYFACETNPRSQDSDGIVYMLNPIDLNRAADPKKARVLDAHTDAPLIASYLRLTGKRNPRGRKTVAIDPVWNSERIMVQQGAFTLHGSRDFTLTYNHAPSVVRFTIPGESKQRVLQDLERVGINEMSIFPEPEHMCHYLVWREKLNALGA
jgi:hypothetical protein